LSIAAASLRAEVVAARRIAPPRRPTQGRFPCVTSGVVRAGARGL